jgi:Activator of Hsp90 ATPase homolog 1-like protein
VLTSVNVQPMSCDPSPAVHKTVDIPASVDAVWEEIAAGDWLGAGAEIDARPGGAVRAGARIGVVEAAERGRSLSFWWTSPADDDRPSRVDVEIEAVGDVTRVWVREVRPELDVRALVPVSEVRPDVRRPRALARA